MRDPFKLHPLPPLPPSNEWEDDDFLDLDDSIPPSEMSLNELPAEVELEVNEQLVLKYLALEHLRSSYPNQPYLGVKDKTDPFWQYIVRETSRLRAHRSEITVVLELSDAGADPEDAAVDSSSAGADPEDAGGNPSDAASDPMDAGGDPSAAASYPKKGKDSSQSTRTLELARLPAIIGREPAPVHLAFHDPEMPALKGYFFQCGRHLVYRDLAGGDGTMLERTASGKMQFIVLKGDPSPVVAGDKLIFVGPQSFVIVKEIRSGRAAPMESRLLGLAPSHEEAPPRLLPAPAPFEPEAESCRPESESLEDDQPEPPHPPASTPPPATRGTRPSRALLATGMLVVLLIGAMVGWLMAPTTETSPKHSESLQAALPTRPAKGGSPSLELDASGQLHLLRPHLPRGARFFMVPGLSDTAGDEEQIGPFALAEVLGDKGETHILYLPKSTPRSLLASARAVEALPNDPQVPMFMALAALQKERWTDARATLEVLVSDENAPAPAFKAMAVLELRDKELTEAIKHLQRSIRRNRDDAEAHMLLARAHVLELRGLPSASPAREELQVKARSNFEEALRLWLPRDARGFSGKGHELQLSGRDLLDEYLLFLASLEASREDATQERLASISARSTKVSSSGSAGDLLSADSVEKGKASAQNEEEPSEAGAAPASDELDAASGAEGHSLVRIPGGKFRMGGGADDPTDERGHEARVEIRTFYIDKFEVSNAQYESLFPEHEGYRGPSKNDGDPVVNVTWSQAQSYCQRQGMRLPTEAEWEKAARGTDGRLYPWGNSPPDSRLLNYRKSGIGRPQSVKSNPTGASPYGIFNMAGNVWEWTADYYDPHYYSVSPSRNPTGPASGTHRSIRGGSYDDDANDARAQNRAASRPSSSASKIGFRCAK